MPRKKLTPTIYDRMLAINARVTAGQLSRLLGCRARPATRREVVFDIGNPRAALNSQALSPVYALSAPVDVPLCAADRMTFTACSPVSTSVLITTS